jgi:long-chain acyl-CoA synthetase
MHKEFDADESELTRTRKLRREFMEVRYTDLITAVYRNEDEIKVTAPVTYRDGRKGTVSTGIKIRTVAEGLVRNNN